jgi:hypothetical protein
MTVTLLAEGSVLEFIGVAAFGTTLCWFQSQFP